VSDRCRKAFAITCINCVRHVCCLLILVSLLKARCARVCDSCRYVFVHYIMYVYCSLYAHIFFVDAND
jgi:hypothetical protein